MRPLSTDDANDLLFVASVSCFAFDLVFGRGDFGASLDFAFDLSSVVDFLVARDGDGEGDERFLSFLSTAEFGERRDRVAAAGDLPLDFDFSPSETFNFEISGTFDFFSSDFLSSVDVGFDDAFFCVSFSSCF